MRSNGFETPNWHKDFGIRMGTVLFVLLFMLHVLLRASANRKRTEKLRPKSKAFFCNFSILNLILGWISEEKPSFFAEKSDRYVYELNSTLKETFWNLKMILLQLKMGLTYFRSVFYINDRRVIVIVFDP